MGNRKKAMEVLLGHLAKIDKYCSVKNGDLWKKKLEGLSDSQFDSFMKSVRDGKACFYLTIPNMSDRHPLISEWQKFAKSLGVEMFKPLLVKNPQTGQTYETPHKYMVARIPIRRMQQYGEHKISLPEGDSRIDAMTGQVAHGDRAANITAPEMEVGIYHELHDTLKEIVAIRGGNIEATQSGIRKQAEETGQVRLADIDDNSLNRTAVTASVWVEGMHLENNITEKDNG